MRSVLHKGGAPIAHHIDRNMAPGGGLIVAGLASLMLWAAIAGIVAIV